MDEKEFLESFMLYTINKYGDTDKQVDDHHVKDFLLEHHKNYREVYFFKKDIAIEIQNKQQVRIKLQDFVEFLIPYLDHHFVQEKIEQYINERLYK